MGEKNFGRGASRGGAGRGRGGEGRGRGGGGRGGAGSGKWVEKADKGGAVEQKKFNKGGKFEKPQSSNPKVASKQTQSRPGKSVGKKSHVSSDEDDGSEDEDEEVENESEDEVEGGSEDESEGGEEDESEGGESDEGEEDESEGEEEDESEGESDEGEEDESEGGEEDESEEEAPTKKRKRDEEPQKPNKKAKDGNAAGIFVSQLNYDTDEEDLKKFFSSCGEIENVSIARQDGRSRGFGFVDFASPDAIPKALKLNDKEFAGRRIVVKKNDKSEKSKGASAPEKTGKLFISGVNTEMDEDDLKKKFDKFGSLEHFKFLNEKGIAFATYSSVEEANKAVSALNGKEIEGNEISVTFARIKTDGGRGGRGGFRGRGRGGFRGGRGDGGDRGGRGGGFRGGFRGGRGGGGFRGGRGGDRGGRGGDRGGRGFRGGGGRGGRGFRD